MDGKQKGAAAVRIYQDFEPPTELSTQNDNDTLLLYLPGFKKEQLKVQLSKTRQLIISGEHPVGDDTWRRFQKTVSVSPNCDLDKICAKFEDHILYIIQPKLITLEKKQDQEKLTSATTQEPPKPVVNKQKPENNVKDKAAQKPFVSTSQAEDAYKTNNVKANGRGDGTDEEWKDSSSVSEDYSSVSEDSSETGENDSAGKTRQKAATDDKNNWEAEDYKMKRNTNQSGLSTFTNKMDGGAPSAGLARKVKMPRQVISLVVAILLVAALTMYVINTVSFWKQAENRENDVI